MPVIDLSGIASPGEAFTSPILINLFLALLMTIVFAVSGIVMGRLTVTDAKRVQTLFDRLPLQVFLTLVILSILQFLIPDAHAQGFAGATSPSLLRIPLYAAVFFLVVGSSNYLFNNLVTSEGDRVHEWIVAHPLVRRMTGRTSGRLSTEGWLIIALFIAYGVIGAFINPQFHLIPSAQIGIALITTISVIVSGYLKDLVRFALARTWRFQAWFKANVAGLFIAVACIALSRSLALSPGYIYGAPIGLFIASSSYAKREGLFESLGMLGAMVIALLLWMLTPFTSSYQVLSDLCNLFFVIVAEHTFFEMLPLPYLAGGSIFRWRVLVWGIECVAILFLLLQTLFNPKGTMVGLAQSPPCVTTLLLLGCYTVGILLLWGWIVWGRKKRG